MRVQMNGWGGYVWQQQSAIMGSLTGNLRTIYAWAQ